MSWGDMRNNMGEGAGDMRNVLGQEADMRNVLRVGYEKCPGGGGRIYEKCPGGRGRYEKCSEGKEQI